MFLDDIENDLADAPLTISRNNYKAIIDHAIKQGKLRLSKGRAEVSRFIPFNRTNSKILPVYTRTGLMIQQPLGKAASFGRERDISVKELRYLCQTDIIAQYLIGYTNKHANDLSIRVVDVLSSIILSMYMERWNIEDVIGKTNRTSVRTFGNDSHLIETSIASANVVKIVDRFLYEMKISYGKVPVIRELLLQVLSSPFVTSGDADNIIYHIIACVNNVIQHLVTLTHIAISYADEYNLSESLCGIRVQSIGRSWYFTKRAYRSHHHLGGAIDFGFFGGPLDKHGQIDKSIFGSGVLKVFQRAYYTFHRIHMPLVGAQTLSDWTSGGRLISIYDVPALGGKSKYFIHFGVDHGRINETRIGLTSKGILG